MNVIVILCDTLRRDHVGAYNLGRPLNECWSTEAPPWRVPTPNMDRLAARGTVFDNCWAGSTPCMPARRDIYTGRYEFLERGWGPLEEEDLDLPRAVSGPPNMSLRWMAAQGHRVSYLVSDHFHLWEQGACNYHVGYTGFEFIRGCEADAYRTDPVEFACPQGDLMGKYERHWRNVHFIRQREGDYFCAQCFDRAADWLGRNASHKDFYLHLDIFDPHEPWDPPEGLLKQFDPAGYATPGVSSGAPYAPWRDKLTPQQFNAYRARYAAKVVFLDRQLGRLLDALDRLDLWKDTLVVLTTDHGTFNGDHGRMGKLQTHEFDCKSHIPFIAAHPSAGHGQRRSQLVQLVDLYPTVLAAVGKPLPQMPPHRPIHGVNLLDAIERDAPTRPFALAGQFGRSVTITDGRWVLHQSPLEGNSPLNWHGYCLSKFLPGYELGPYRDGCRPCRTESWQTPTWLSDLAADPNELANLADDEPQQLHRMRQALHDVLAGHYPSGSEQLARLGLA
jgi:arylsulfatase A-like enzyme